MAQRVGTNEPSSEQRAPQNLPSSILREIADGLNRECPSPMLLAGEDDAPQMLVSFDLHGFRYCLSRRPLAEDVHLSPREAEIIRLVAAGLPNKCIGAVLEISTWTVATHLRRIFAKLGVSSRAAMIARVDRTLTSGIVRAPEAGLPAPSAARSQPAGRERHLLVAAKRPDPMAPDQAVRRGLKLPA